MATATQIISKALRLFDEETSSKFEQDGNRTTALELLNDGYFEICVDSLCSRTSYSLTTVAGTREYDLPGDFAAIIEIFYAEDCVFLSPCHYRNIFINDNGLPSEWYLTPDKIGFNLIPDSAYVFTMDYLKGPTADLTLTDSPSLIPSVWQLRVLPFYVLWQLFAIDKREEVSSRAPFWGNVYREKLAKMKEWFSGEGRYAGTLPGLE